MRRWIMDLGLLPDPRYAGWEEIYLADVHRGQAFNEKENGAKIVEAPCSQHKAGKHCGNGDGA